MTSVSSHRSRSSASSNHSSHRHRKSHSRSGSRRRSAGSESKRSASHSTDDRSRSHSRSRSRSRSNYSRSRSLSRSVSKRSRSWSRSRSHSADRGSYFSRSRSHTRSRSSSSYGDGGRRRSYPHSSSRSHSRGSSARSRSRSPASPPSLLGGKDPRDRSKRVKWGNAIWLVGEKAKDVLFHFCDVCDLPVVIYGRLLPCKHVLCFTCAAELPNKCNRCHKTIQTIERCLIGGIFMCFESDGCRRTYLSQRDLQAHIDHRHKGSAVAQATTTSSESKTTGCAIPSVISSKLTLDEPTRASLSSTTSLIAASKELISSSHPIQQQIQQSIKPTATSTCNSATSHTGTSSFHGTGKSMGLLPLPKQATPQPPSTLPLHGRLPIGVNHPTMRLPNLGAFPQLSQFSTPPPPLGGPRNIPPPPSVMNPSVPPPSVPPPQSGPPSQQQHHHQQSTQPFGNASALAALAAAFSAQSKASALTSCPDNLLASSGPLQTAGINLSLISNVLRNANAAWAAQPNALSNLPNMTQQTNLHPSNQLLNPRPGPMNMRRFPP